MLMRHIAKWKSSSGVGIHPSHLLSLFLVFLTERSPHSSLWSRGLDKGWPGSVCRLEPKHDIHIHGTHQQMSTAFANTSSKWSFCQVSRITEKADFWNSYWEYYSWFNNIFKHNRKPENRENKKDADFIPLYCKRGMMPKLNTSQRLNNLPSQKEAIIHSRSDLIASLTETELLFHHEITFSERKKITAS